MPLTYEQDSGFKALASVLDEHAEWLGRLMRKVFYPETHATMSILSIPDSFDAWARAVADNEAVQAETLDNLKRLHGDLRMSAEQMLYDSGNAGARPDLRAFDAFIVLYDEFIAHMRRLERDMALSDTGLDVLTGLRSRQMLAKDIEKEMERRSRRGRPFCMALARIDHYADIKNNLPQKEFDSLIVAVGEIIKKCLRSFDDAYRLGNGEFLMCLKQADMSGGSAGLLRLRKLLEEDAPYYSVKGQGVRLTMSSCVAEPQPGDVFEELMANMRNDLDRFGGDAETALEYLEVSPLERFIHGLEDESKKTH
jgi:diguanylate cyclase (GGDEF)-like protein